MLSALVIVAAGLLGTAGCHAQVASPGAAYDGHSPVSRVYTYVFIDIRPDYMPEAFERRFKESLLQELTRSGIPNQQLWFSDTQAGRDLLADPKASTAANLISIPLGNTVRENIQQDMAFKASHRLFIYPTETHRSREGASFTVRWEFRDTQTGDVDWALYTTTHSLWRSMDPGKAEIAATDYVAAIVAEMRRCKVIPDVPR
jgi:hypothetical protein